MKIPERKKGRVIKEKLLSALTNLIANALLSVSGMGAAELAFFIVFEDFVNGVSIASILLLYRLATYFVPFIISIVVLNNVGQYRDREKIGIKEKS